MKGIVPAIRGNQDVPGGVVRAVQGWHAILEAPVLDQLGIQPPIDPVVDLLNGQTLQIRVHGNRPGHPPPRLS